MMTAFKMGDDTDDYKWMNYQLHQCRHEEEGMHGIVSQSNDTASPQRQNCLGCK